MAKKIYGFILIIFSLLLFSGCGNDIVFFADDVVKVEKQDQTTQNLEIIFSQFISNITLVNNLVLGQTIFNISSDVPPVMGNYVCLKDRNGNIFTQDEIINVTSLGGNLYTIEIISGVETNFTTEDGCSLTNTNMAVDGSITPQTFFISPELLDPKVEWDITRIICYSTGDGVGVTDDKPDLTALFTTDATQKGILFRLENTIYYKNLFYANTNEDFVLSSFDYDITEASKFGEYSFIFRKTINGDDKSGVVARLSANISNDMYHRFVAIVERDLTDITKIQCKVMGHETDNFQDSLLSG